MKFWQRNKSIPVSVSLVSPFKPGFFNKRRLLYISFLAFLLGGAISYIAHLLILLINLVTNISFYGVFSAIPASPAGNTLGLFVILIPAIGGLVVGVLALYGSKAIRGHGIPEAMEKILTNQSKIPPAITYLKPVATAISIGTGGPFGAEGPIIATGGALGSTLGQLLKITHNERKILLASGATAGMAAIFGTPIAAIFLAIELLLFEFSPRSIIPVAIACITGAAGKHIFFGAEPVFFMNVKIEAASTEALLFYGILGLIFGILSILVTKCVYFIEDLFEKLPLHWMWWPAIGGLFVGFIGYFAPQTLGVGYNNITNLLNEELTVKVLGSLFILKFLSWSISLGSGTAGGTLAPLLTIGGAAGALCGICINSYFPEAGVPVHVAALVGMSAMFAGASRALLTSIIFALETTNQANALLPLLAACAGAYIVSFFLMENTIMTEKIARRGIKTPDSFEPDPLENILISEVLQKEDDILISENNTIGELREWLSKLATIKNYYIVTDDSGKYKGIISSLDIMNYTNSNESGIEGLLRTNVSTVSENLTLRLAAEKMDSLNIDFLPVLDERNRKIAGLITNSQIIEAYSSRNADHKKNHPSISLKRRGMEIIIHGRNFFEKSTK